MRRSWLTVGLPDESPLGRAQLAGLIKTALGELGVEHHVSVASRKGAPVLKLEAWDDTDYRELEARVTLRLSVSGYRWTIERGNAARRARLIGYSLREPAIDLLGQ